VRLGRWAVNSLRFHDGGRNLSPSLRGVVKFGANEKKTRGWEQQEMAGENDKTWAGVNLGPRGARSINCLFSAARLNADYKGGLRVIAVAPRVATEILNFLLVLPVDRQGIQFRVVTESLSEAFRDYRECYEGPRGDEDMSIRSASNIVYQSFNLPQNY